MKHYTLLTILSWFLIIPFLQAQQLEGSFSIQGKEEAEITMTLTAIAGQPFEGTQEGIALSYGFIEVVSTNHESATVNALRFPQESLALETGVSHTLTAVFNPEEVDNPLLNWFSSNPEVAAVQSGTLSALKAGTTVITAVSACGMYSAQCQVTVSEPEPDPEPEPEPTPDPEPEEPTPDPEPEPDPEPDPIWVTDVEITPTEVTLTVGETAVLSATVFPTDADNPAVTWSTSDETVVTVQEGLITAVAPGTAVIKVTTVDGNYTASCLVTVEKDATGIEGISTGIKVYPTVTTDNVNIELATPKTVYLIDLSGKVRAIVSCTSGTNVISLHAYPAGIYFIRIDNGVTKVVKR